MCKELKDFKYTQLPNNLESTDFGNCEDFEGLQNNSERQRILRDYEIFQMMIFWDLEIIHRFRGIMKEFTDCKVF